jgi:peptide/nickel transport system ATP-binding protein
LPEPILAANGLRKTFAPRRGILEFVTRRPLPAVRPALNDVSVTLDAGEVLGVVGESGSGKSTLARCLTLLTRPDAGRILFEGADLMSVDGEGLRRIRHRIQVVFQDPFSSLNPRLTVRDAIAEVLQVHRLVPRDGLERRVDELLHQVGLSKRARSRYPSDFSGGQRQRICIARALAAEPRILIADEAVSALDVSIQAQILNLLLDLREGLGLSMIFISHNLHVVRHVAPRIAVMFGGRIVEMLPPGVPLEAAEHPYTVALLAALPRLQPAVAVVPERASPDLARALPIVGCPFRERCPRAFEPCPIDDPALVAVAPGHRVACHEVAIRRGVAGDEPTTMTGIAGASGGMGATARPRLFDTYAPATDRSGT